MSTLDNKNTKNVKKTSLPEVIAFTTNENSNTQSISEVWLRISTFFSLKSINTQRTYTTIISEWSNFLGAIAGSIEAGEKILKATDLQAIAYRKWLENKPGQKSRLEKNALEQKNKNSSISKNTDLQKLINPIYVETNKQKKLDGIQSTQSNATIAKKILILRRIYKLLITANLYTSKNPFDSDLIPIPSKNSGKKRPTEMLPYEAVTELLKLPNESTEKGLRDACLLAILFGAGLRRSEALNLRLGDIKKSAAGTVYLSLRATKGKTDSDVSIPDWAAEKLEKLIQYRKAAQSTDLDFLFISFRGKGGEIRTNQQFSDSGLYKMFVAYCKKINISEWVSPHSARATAITKLLDQGYTHRQVQEFSRHASVQMVEAYDKKRTSLESNPGLKLKF